MTAQTALDVFQELTTHESLRLESVSERIVDGCRELIVLRFANAVLSFQADADTDTIEVRCQDVEALDLAELDPKSDAAPWSSLIGKEFGSGWVTLNQQGYQDGVLLSFGGMQPSVLLSVMASSIEDYVVKR